MTRFWKCMSVALALTGFCAQALAQVNSDDATNQDNPVRVRPCAWLAVPVKDDSILILGTAWAGRGHDVKATRQKAADCMKLAPEAVTLPAPCPNGMIGVMSDQTYQMC